ncbi:hypothetical protein F5Y09DRAFT_324560 [Xylaria sp. FL1042]|nr:hypothetical protein F5Y09DRAFT_324560 [Xylaria sp. FL1042]
MADTMMVDNTMADNEKIMDAICKDAIDGKLVPDDEHLDKDFVRASLTRGIRLHYDFAMSDDVRRLALMIPSIARARHARMIMSNSIPEFMAEDQLPYCIWHPEFAKEGTYRALRRQYPRMEYVVGRACAAAGYDALYFELHLSPDVSIAEEARESGTDGGDRIYDSIMNAPVRYAIMNDFGPSINLENRQPAFLNGDTVVHWLLEYRSVTPWKPNYRFPDIEEDMHADKEACNLTVELNEADIELLYTPLPQDLPTVKKTLLIQMAAFEGNIDRYSRLAVPQRTMSPRELLCVVRGIYHHTMFARWWDEEITGNTPRAQAAAKTNFGHKSHLEKIKKAISARRIMLNDSRQFNEGWEEGEPQPYLIWWPLRPTPETLAELAEKVPGMREQAAVAGICCDYEDVYRSIQPIPNDVLWFAALKSSNPFYRRDIERRAIEKGISLSSPNSFRGAESEDLDLDDPDPQDPVTRMRCLIIDQEPTQNFDTVDSMYDGVDEQAGPYDDDGLGPNANATQFEIWSAVAQDDSF